MPVEYDMQPQAVSGTDPSPQIIAITPANTDLTIALRRIRIGVGGSLVVTDMRGNQVTFPTVTSGEYITGWFTQIRSTGTTATGIVGWT